MKLHGTGPNTFPMTIPEPASQAAIAAVKDAAVTSNIDSCPATACDVSEHCWPSLKLSRNWIVEKQYGHTACTNI